MVLVLPSILVTHPLYLKPMYTLTPKEKAEVGQQLVALLDKGFAWPSQFALGASIICVAKKNGEPRMRVDPSALNHVIVKDKCPLPHIDNLLDGLQ